MHDVCEALVYPAFLNAAQKFFFLLGARRRAQSLTADVLCNRHYTESPVLYHVTHKITTEV